jgi:hypothetical protein
MTKHTLCHVGQLSFFWLLLASGLNGQIEPGIPGRPNALIGYSASTGELWVDDWVCDYERQGRDVDFETGLNSMYVHSASGVFDRHENVQHLTGSFDFHSETEVFKVTFGDDCFGPLLSLGDVAEPGLSEEFLRTDLHAVGSGCGCDFNSYYLNYVPEPNLAPGGRRNDETVSIVYEANTGEIAVDVPPSRELIWLGIYSAQGILTGGLSSESVERLGSRYVYRSLQPFEYASFDRQPLVTFGSFRFGPVAEPGLAEWLLLGDISVVGSHNPSRSVLGEVSIAAADLIYLDVPEPSTLIPVLLALAGLSVVDWPRRRGAMPT